MVTYLNLFTCDYHFMKMPKLKRASAAHSASQAKKKKRNEREDPVK